MHSWAAPNVADAAADRLVHSHTHCVYIFNDETGGALYKSVMQYVWLQHKFPQNLPV